jgi:hypothetical protein
MFGSIPNIYHVPSHFFFAFVIQETKWYIWTYFLLFSHPLAIRWALGLIRLNFTHQKGTIVSDPENDEVQNKAIKMSAGRELCGSVCMWLCERMVLGKWLVEECNPSSLYLASHLTLTKSIGSCRVTKGPWLSVPYLPLCPDQTLGKHLSPTDP